MKNYTATDSNDSQTYTLKNEPEGFIFRDGQWGHSGHHATLEKCVKHALSLEGTIVTDVDTGKRVTLSDFEHPAGDTFIAVYKGNVYQLKKNDFSSTQPYSFVNVDGTRNTLSGCFNTTDRCIEHATKLEGTIVINTTLNKVVTGVEYTTTIQYK